jgi:hypothetical protein
MAKSRAARAVKPVSERRPYAPFSTVDHVEDTHDLLDDTEP